MDRDALSFFDRLKGTEAVKVTASPESSPVAKALSKEPDFATPVTLRNLFTHHEAHPTVLDLALMKAFGYEWFKWEPETLWAEIQRTFKTQVSEHNRAKIQAVKTVHVSHLVWESWPVFEKVIQVLNGNLPDWENMQKCSLDQLYAGVDMLNGIRDEKYSDEVKLYMAACVLEDNVFFVPPPLDFIQMEVNQPQFRCKDCGSEDLALFHDGICDTCSMKFDPEQGFSMQPLEERRKLGIGSNTEVIVRFDHRPMVQRWKELEGKETEKVKFEETMVDVQVQRLMIARDYMNIRRKQLIDQLTSLKSWMGT